MLYLCLFIENKKKLAVGVTLEFSHKPGSVTSCFVRKNRAEKSSDWLRPLDIRWKMGMPHMYRPMQSCEENHVFSNFHCNLLGINNRRAFLIQSLEIGCEKDILKICHWDLSYSVVNKNGRRVKCQDFCTLCRVALSWNLISC